MAFLALGAAGGSVIAPLSQIWQNAGEVRSRARLTVLLTNLDRGPDRGEPVIVAGFMYVAEALVALAAIRLYGKRE